LGNIPKLWEGLCAITRNNLLRSFKLIGSSRDKSRLFGGVASKTQYPNVGQSDSKAPHGGGKELANFIHGFNELHKKAAEAKSAYSNVALTGRKRSATKEGLSMTQRLITRNVDFMTRNSMKVIS